MTETGEIVLKVIGLILALAGMVVVFLAARIVDSRGLADKKQVDSKVADEMTPEDLAKYKRDSAILDVKLRGLFLAAPGFVIILFIFR